MKTQNTGRRHHWHRHRQPLELVIVAFISITLLNLNHLVEAATQQQQPPTRPFAHLVSASTISRQYSTSSANTNPDQHPSRSILSLPTIQAPLKINNNNKNLLVEPVSSSLSSPTSSVPSLTLVAQSSPLVWQPPQQLLSQQQAQQSTPDLDNVIESTTTSQTLSIKVVDVANNNLKPHSAACQLPLTWAGRWYQSNKEPIRITNTEISDKGLCRDQKGDKYLFQFAGNSNNRHQTGPCLVCLVINERHLNVLQYKESSCQPIPPNYLQNRSLSTNFNNLLVDNTGDHSLLDTICSDITGDAQLESLFRLDTPPIECPISGQYSFTYDACREPQSSLDSCIDKRQLNFKFAACPDVPGSESKSEVLKCYADWSEGNNYYMIGRLESTSNQQDKGKFRCFLYERSFDGKIIQMAQSLEESCYGLINANEGPKTLRLASRPPPSANQKCQFPSYIQGMSDNWLSVDNSLIYMFNPNSTKYSVKETKEGNVIEEATCIQQFPTITPQASNGNNQHPHLNYNNQALSSSSSSSSSYQLGRAAASQAISSNDRRFPATSSGADQSAAQKQITTSSSRLATGASESVYLVQITKNCHTSNYCVRFHKRSNGIVQIDYFVTSPTDHQCRSAYYGLPQTQIITSTNLEHQRCPFEGAYTLEGSLESDLSYNPSNIFICPRQSYLTSQCDHPSRLRIYSRCSPSIKVVKNLYCLGSWTSNGHVRLLLADDDRQRYSAWYRDQYSSDESGSTIARTIDLQVGLITPLQAKAMQVRLTKRAQCSELRNPAYQNPSSMISLQSASPYAAAGSGASSLRRSLTPEASALLLICGSLMSLYATVLSIRRH